MPDNFIPLYDLDSLNEQQRRDYIKAVCKHLGVPDDLNLVALTYVDDAEGPARLVPYAKRGATECVRNNLEIAITSLTNQMIGGSIVFTVTAFSKVKGRQEIASGSKFIEGLSGALLDDAIMTASTRALRRVTLQFVGAGVLDESEVNQRKTIHVTPKAVPVAPQPTVQPSSEPGKDITFIDISPFEKHPTPEFNELQKAIPAQTETISQEEFEAVEAEMRVDAIAKLNAIAPEPITEESKKPRRGRKPKAKVDMGVSEPPKPDIKPDPQPEQRQTTVFPPAVTEPPKPDIKPDPQYVPAKPRLTQAQVTPFRQRNFAIMEVLENEGGFVQSEGIGRSEKFRMLAQLMFPEVSNMNQLDEAQWEKFLSNLENKIKSVGPKETVNYIEESINL